MDQYNRISIRQDGTVAVVELLDQQVSDLTTLSDLGEELSDFIKREKPTCVLLNLNKVRYVTSSTIEILIRSKNQVSSEAGQLKLCCLSPVLVEVLETLKLTSVFDIHESEANGIAAFET